MADKIIFKNTTQEANLETIQAADILNGEMLLVRETDKEHLYCKNSNGEISKIHHIIDPGEIDLGPEYRGIDLGLPSGTLWANKNLGAENYKDVGLYFAWGETVGYTENQVGIDKDFNSNNSDYELYNNGNYIKYNSSDGSNILESIDDAATQIIGPEWKIPTRENLIELVANTDIYIIPIDSQDEIQATYTGGTTYTFTFPRQTPIEGLKFYNKNDHDKFIYHPMTGNGFSGQIQLKDSFLRFWTSSLNVSNVANAYMLQLNTYSGLGQVFYDLRCIGVPIRAVKSPQSTTYKF